MHCSFDRTGFPYVVLDKLRLHVGLLPVTKIQFERYLADVTPESDLWYEPLLTLNPRISPTRVTPTNREQLFFTGLLSNEAEAFANWLGNGYRVPTVREWRTVYKHFSMIPFSTIGKACVSKKNCSIPVQTLLQRLHQQLAPKNTLEFSLMQNGLVEWVQEAEEWLGLGAPRPAFLNNLWNPLVDTVRPIKPDKRNFYFGLRLVKHV